MGEAASRVTIREDFLAAYIAQHNCTPEYAEAMLGTVEAAHAETERILREERIEELREHGERMDPVLREGEIFHLTRQVAILSSFVEIANLAAQASAEERDWCWKELDERDGEQMRIESNERKRLQEVIDQRTRHLHFIQKLCRSRSLEALGRRAYAEDLKAKISEQAHEIDRWLAFIERGITTHMQFNLRNPDGTTTELPCADWCHACEVEKLQAEVSQLNELVDAYRRRPPKQEPRGVLYKQSPDEDLYIGWSTMAEGPKIVGTRQDMLDYGYSPERIGRADKTGTSSMIGDGTWDDDSYIAEQRGILRRKHLALYSQRLLRGEYENAWDLLEPFDDEDEASR